MDQAKMRKMAFVSFALCVTPFIAQQDQDAALFEALAQHVSEMATGFDRTAKLAEDSAAAITSLSGDLEDAFRLLGKNSERIEQGLSELSVQHESGLEDAREVLALHAEHLEAGDSERATNRGRVDAVESFSAALGTHLDVTGTEMELLARQVDALSILHDPASESFLDIDFFRTMTATILGVFIAAMLAWRIDVWNRRVQRERSRQALLRMFGAALKKNEAHLTQMVKKELQSGVPTYQLARAHFDSTVMTRADLLSRDNDLADALNHLAFETEHINRRLDLLLQMTNRQGFVAVQTATRQIASDCIRACQAARGKLKQAIE